MNLYGHRCAPGASRLPVWISGLVALALFAGLAWHLSPLSPGALALQLAWTPRAFGEIVHFWSDAELARYRSHLPVDYALLAAYGAFGYLLSTRTGIFGGRGAGYRRIGTWLLPAAALLDALENALHCWLTEVPRFGMPLVYAASAGAAWLKWLLIIGFLLMCAWAAARDGD
ncbi:hypothetical protein [Quisquiliibacterium transsilvanicum]|uniref:Transmembrane protein n=1 Tax=Quisquiliibacterium transsilvanicum TaxID=1549638 RepID=A0A7W8MB41_9BURK|nr:hypothetical protein [Quisquiliibacterium transsilvanicum]MBB5273764.1 hypothetical protein [Quisquiliibacterium transsilvanicum]